MNGEQPPPERTIAQLIEQLGRTAHGEAFIEELNPAQWAALRYFARANRFSQTVGAFARYHGTTRGTATQTVKSLVSKHFLKRCPIKTDRRSFRLELTPKARNCLAGDPFHDLETAARTLPFGQRSTVVKGLQTILHQLASARDHTVFGICSSCTHLSCEKCTRDRTIYECALLDEPLKEEDLNGICVNYKPQSSI
jgi:DNA-binding MarR family transcriptional regulator